MTEMPQPPSHPTEPPDRSWGRRLLRSSGAATASQVWRFGVTLATQVILRKILPPGTWGVWMWAVDVVFLLAAQLRDLGLPPLVVRDPRRPYGNFLALEGLWGGILAAGIALGAPFLARLSPADDPATVQTTVLVIQALCVFLLIEGLGRVALTYFEAELLIERALLPEVSRNLCFAVVAIALAWNGLGIWSLVIAHLSASALFTGLLWWRARAKPPRMTLNWVPGEMHRLLASSLPLMLMAFLLLSIEWADLQVLSLRFGEDTVGYYSAALALALMMPRVLELPIRRALYPAFVAVRDDARRFFETYRLATLLLMAVQVPFALFVFLNAETILVLYATPEYAVAAPWLQALCFYPIIQPFARCAEDVILTLHQEWLLIAASVVTLVSLAGFGWWLTADGDPQGMAWAKLLPLGALLITWAMYRVNPRAFRSLASELVVLYLIPLPFFALAWWLGAGDPWLRVGLSVIAGLLTAALYWRKWGRDFLEFFR
jgi:PST family polysaccharide transporter